MSAGYLARASERFAERGPKAIFDILSPVPSHLVNMLLDARLGNPRKSRGLYHRLIRTRENLARFPLTQGHHLVYFPFQDPTIYLGPDGTDPTHAPGPPYVRRMWAGGSLSFDDDWAEDMLLDNRAVRCIETVDSVRGSGNGNGVADEDSAGDKVYVDVRRRYGVAPWGDKAAAATLKSSFRSSITEVRSLVFLKKRVPSSEDLALLCQPPKLNSPRKPQSDKKPDFEMALTVDAQLLFHFSALTYNAHAIHLDPEYARNVEGYRERLVHGPLTLMLLMAALRRVIPWSRFVKSIKYRNIRPLYAGDRIRICVNEKLPPPLNSPIGDRTFTAWIEGPDGQTAVTGRARVRRTPPPRAERPPGWSVQWDTVAMNKGYEAAVANTQPHIGSKW
ncbi:HotDog domain-containing protein [Lasiosphaeria ovina]|uniref:HotDog domain-containing protein n=1 Tax=Lasiosphaeria ovina TaxID=92902 RepID=A0AAE0NEH3_9PEZI|nr:HotDog domain-containing protein [Lasiosphaeria ovina]